MRINLFPSADANAYSTFPAFSDAWELGRFPGTPINVLLVSAVSQGGSEGTFQESASLRIIGQGVGPGDRT